jgi:hypothetical protein
MKTPTQLAEEWLKANDWDYQKYGDRRPDRSAYSTHMNYEISDLLEWAFLAGHASRDEDFVTLEAAHNLILVVLRDTQKIGNEVLEENARLREIVKRVLHARQCNAPHGQMEKMPTVYALQEALNENVKDDKE